VAIPQSVLDDIRAKIPLSSLVRKKVKLQKAGKEFKGLSPFNQEKTPSFFVNDVKQFYHCFSSGKNGDCFSWLQETEGLTFVEAVERLADEVGVRLPTRGPEEEAEYRDCQKFYAELQRENQDYQFELDHTPSGAAFFMLDSRGIARNTVAEFGLGYAREGRFRDRVTFPIHDPQGRVIAFSGRAIGKDQQPKYLNSPESPIFSKGKTLYNFHRAREAARDAGTIIVVEGQMDVISMWQAGYKNVVAPLGTALTVDQLELLWSVVNEPIICFDGDKAGERATNRAIDLALGNLRGERSLRFVYLPDGQDPDSLAREYPLTLSTIFDQTASLSDALWARETSSGVNTPEKRTSALSRLLEAVKTIPDGQHRSIMRRMIMERMNVLGRREAWKPKVKLPPPPNSDAKEKMVASIAVARPDLVSRYADKLASIRCKNQTAALVLNAVLVGSEPSLAPVAEAFYGPGAPPSWDFNSPQVEDLFRELLGLPVEAEP
jgi:DNA primase